MKLIMTLLVRDEQDIIRENIEFHLAQGVDFFIATDNKSVDATTDILKEYQARGLLHYIYEGDDNYNQHAWTTRMARLAHTQYNADWVINNDADEFWWPTNGTLKESFSKLPAEVNLLQAQRYNFVVTGNTLDPFWMRMVYREKTSLNPSGKPLLPKIAHRSSKQIRVSQGNHSAEGIQQNMAAKNLIEILHYPIRSHQQIENKIALGGAAYERNRELSENIGKTWRKLYTELKQDTNLNHYYQSQFYDKNRLAEAMHQGDILIDNRLFNYMKNLPINA